jgi:hypothetical protein
MDSKRLLAEKVFGVLRQANQVTTYDLFRVISCLNTQYLKVYTFSSKRVHLYSEASNTFNSDRILIEATWIHC